MRCSAPRKANFLERRLAEVRRITLLSTSVNSPLGGSLGAFPLDRVEHLLRLREDLLELPGVRPSINDHRFALNALQNDRPGCIPFVSAPVVTPEQGP